MDNKKMAKLLAKRCYKVNSNNEGDFATQLFIENIVLPKDCTGYTDEQMESFIFNFLENR